jgi:hypothetical protein
MSGARGSRMFSNVRIDSLRYQSAQIPAGTSGYALSIGADGIVAPNGVLAAATLDVTGDITGDGLLTVPTVNATNMYVTNEICTTNLTVTGTLISGLAHVAGVTDTFYANTYVVGTTDTCYIPGASLDVLGTAHFHEGLSTTFVESRDLYSDLLVVGKSGITGSIVFRDHAGVTIAHIAPSETGLNISTIDYGNHLIVSGVTGTSAGLTPYITGFPFLDIDPSGKQVSINNGTLNVSTLSANLGDSAGISIVSPLQVTAGLLVTGGLTVTGPLAVSGAISNPNSSQPVLVGDSMSVSDALSVGSTVTASGAMRVLGNLTAAGGLTASNVSVQNRLTVGGDLFIREIRNSGSELNVSPNLSINKVAGTTKGDGTLFAGAVTFPTTATGKISARSGDLLVEVPQSQSLRVSTGSNSLYITPKGANQDLYMTYGGTAGASLIVKPTSGSNGIELDSNGNLNVANDMDVVGLASVGSLGLQSMLTLGLGSSIRGPLVQEEDVVVNGNTYQGYYARIGSLLTRWVTTGGITVANPTLSWVGLPFVDTNYIIMGSAASGGAAQPIGMVSAGTTYCQLKGLANTTYVIGFLGQTAP